MKKRYWLALLAIPVVWLYFVGRSAGELRTLLPTVREQPAPPSAAAAAERPALGGAARYAPLPAATVERGPAAPPVAPPPPAELPPAVYADPSATIAADPAASPIEHPEVTDPQMRKLLQPAWDD